MSSKITQQWATFARVWYIVNAEKQAAGNVARVINPILQGFHKPIYHPSSDCGDHVIVYNTRHISLEGEAWVRKIYYHHTGYPGGFTKTPAYEIHANDPTKILRTAIYGMLPTDLRRRTMMVRLHLYPDDVIPPELLANVTEQIKPPVDIPRSIDDYTDEERAVFPKLFIPHEKDYAET